MPLIGEQFGRPRGLLGRLAGRFMARNNAAFNRWLVSELAQELPPPGRVLELGSGPGIGLRHLLATFPNADVYGVDPSAEMRAQAQSRNAQAVAQGRLTFLDGVGFDAAALDPFDLVMAVHVLYFWAEPAHQLRTLHAALAPGGHIVLGYQLREHMPGVAQRDFPKAGHHLYDEDSQVQDLLEIAGFQVLPVRVFGTPDNPGGRLLLAEVG